MLSYNWGHQPIIKQICSNLRNNGIKVWMDVDDMQGSTLQAMASAVEKADIVLVCYSQKYKNSDNCGAGILVIRELRNTRGKNRKAKTFPLTNTTTCYYFSL